MYDKIYYMGMALPQWSIALHSTYTLGEIYRMMQDNVDFSALVSGKIDAITIA